MIEVLLDGRTRMRGYLNARGVRALVDEHLSGRRDQSLRIWALVILELWCRTFLDGGGWIQALPDRDRNRDKDRDRAHA